LIPMRWNAGSPMFPIGAWTWVRTSGTIPR
jgi:hypothetical protein